MQLSEINHKTEWVFGFQSRTTVRLSECSFKIVIIHQRHVGERGSSSSRPRSSTKIVRYRSTKNPFVLHDRYCRKPTWKFVYRIRIPNKQSKYSRTSSRVRKRWKIFCPIRTGFHQSVRVELCLWERWSSKCKYNEMRPQRKTTLYSSTNTERQALLFEPTSAWPFVDRKHQNWNLRKKARGSTCMPFHTLTYD